MRASIVVVFLVLLVGLSGCLAVNETLKSSIKSSSYVPTSVDGPLVLDYDLGEKLSAQTCVSDNTTVFHDIYLAASDLSKSADRSGLNAVSAAVQEIMAKMTYDSLFVTATFVHHNLAAKETCATVYARGLTIKKRDNPVSSGAFDDDVTTQVK